MGGEVSKEHFKKRDYKRFQQKLDEEMEFVRRLFAENRFNDHSRKLGYELELCLLDKQGNPAPMNQQILERADNPLFTYELAKFNLEINGNAFPIEANVFDKIEQDLAQLYAQVEQAAHRFDTQIGLFGVLPCLQPQHLDPELYMSGMHRYRVLNDRLLSMRDQPIHLTIQGKDHLKLEKNDVMLEAMGTSLQIHMQVPFSEAVDCYHAALWSSMAALAVSANSPLVLGKSCWQESRIAIFKQSVDTRNSQEIEDSIIPRVHLGKKYIDSWLELFEDNDYYTPILPEVMDGGPEKLHHFNLHNGTIWRWVRPILGEESGQYHLRLELRVAPSGPTQVDTMANMVFYVGLIEGLKQTPEDLTRIPFEVLNEDFYRVARDGLEARVNWCDGDMDTMQNLLLQKAIPVSIQGLKMLGIKDFEKWIEIIRQRVENSATGAHWISQHWEKNRDAFALVRNYLAHAHQNIPVHLWPKP